MTAFKKLAALALALTMILSLAACGAAEAEPDVTSPQGSSSAGSYTVTDIFGREVEIPGEVESVAALGSAARLLFFGLAARQALCLLHGGLRLLCLGQSLLACLLFCAQACICGGKINGLPVVCLGRLFGLCPHGGRCCGGGRALRCRRFRRGLRLGRCRGAALYGNCGFSRRGADTGVVQRVQRLQVAVVLLRAGKAHLLCLYQLLQGAYL